MFEFLHSPRFWAVVFGAVIVYLQAKGWLGELERNLIVTIAGGFVGIRTIDRLGEKIGPK